MCKKYATLIKVNHRNIRKRYAAKFGTSKSSVRITLFRQQKQTSKMKGNHMSTDAFYENTLIALSLVETMTKKGVAGTEAAVFFEEFSHMDLIVGLSQFATWVIHTQAAENQSTTEEIITKFREQLVKASLARE